MKIRTPQRIARFGLVALSAAALTSIGCSLLVTFDDPIEPDAGIDGSTDATADATADTANPDSATFDIIASPETDASPGDADATADTLVDTPAEVDARTDVAPDATPDASDVGPDATPDTARDAGAEADATVDGGAGDSGADVAAETAADSAVDTTPDVGLDTAADTTLDVVAEAAIADVAVETAVDSGPEASGETMARLRFAQLVTSASSLNFCVLRKPSATTDPDWTAATALPISGAGMSSMVVSGYVDLAPGTYEIRVVPGAQRDCKTEVTAGSTYTTPALAAATFTTAAAIGVVGATDATAFRLALLADEPGAAPIGSNLKMRVFHASTALGALDVGVGDSTATVSTYTIDWSNLAFGSAHPASYPLLVGDANNVVAFPFASPLPIGLAPAGSARPTLVRTLTYRNGATLSVFIVDDGATGKFFVCDDSTAALISAGSLTSSCAPL